MSDRIISVLFVCMANICRSPTLMAVLTRLAAEKNLSHKIHVDSCGMGWAHLGERPDPRTFEAAKRKGILIDHRSQQFQDSFFDQFDYIFGVTPDLVEQLKLRASTPEQKAKIGLATEFSARFKDQEIPDPYYMSLNGFDEGLDLMIEACQGILNYLSNKYFS